ncbi:MAG TPA: carbamoyltransferase HypF [Bacteroidales bacterium]|nr:carbamoyltransferase HypF [Bacteroidales bacterium]
MKKENTYQVEVKGLVQGVGFRPFVYRLAEAFNLKGHVENRNDGVSIKINCFPEVLPDFIDALQKKAPQASYIESVTYSITGFEVFTEFRIIKSQTISDKITDISPDLAVCEDCLNDMKTQKNRINYPFINCTNCGPRFTIIQNIPYDRAKTTMHPFKMCPDCLKEYTDVRDRRFHAQPVACSACGPEYTLLEGNVSLKGIEPIITRLQNLLKEGKIIAIKGIGGFFIACDAQNEKAVARLRKLKNREAKPFAVMFSCVDKLKEFTVVNDAEEASLLSFRRPIVLLKQQKSLAPSVNVGFNSLGVMLPYMPVHHLIFEGLDMPAIILTSGNISDEPIITDNDIAKEKLSGITDAILTYNRDIYNRTDDSVVTVVNNKERVFRRSRGYVPNPVVLKQNTDGILAAGAELTNCFAIGRGNKAILSQHIGDLKNLETYEFYCESIDRFKRLFLFKPELVVCDLHPDYLSSRYATNTGLPLVKVQHHHAHIASCIAEHHIEGKVIGVSFDGTGYGDDGHIWGGEFFVCDLNEYKRVTHFDYVPMPGGDKVTDEPWRMAVSYLYKIYQKDFFNLDMPFLKTIDTPAVEMLCRAIDLKINCPLTSSAGRLFDAIAAMTGLCVVSRFHAEAPMRLESIVEENIRESYLFDITDTIIFDAAFKEIISDIKNQVPASHISAKFHNTIVAVITEVAIKIKSEQHLNKVVLSGGTFQNKYLLEHVEKQLIEHGFEVYSQMKVPTNDGGIALGQLAIAAARRPKE